MTVFKCWSQNTHLAPVSARFGAPADNKADSKHSKLESIIPDVHAPRVLA